MESHKEELEFVQGTVEFLLEHTRKAEREEVREKAANFVDRYQSLLATLETYVRNMEVHVHVFMTGFSPRSI